ncbi:MAG: stage II sporulation protein R, partial [Oscillospiraceae bacterium]|nr:stage II sporulation protein R [Candidatus Equicaccousia limihippi]
MLKKIIVSLSFGMVFAILVSMANFDVSCNELRQNVLRLHIIANSDDDFDQQLKLKIRDSVLNSGCECFKNCDNIDDAILTASENTEKFYKIAKDVIVSNGYDYAVDVSVGDSYFENRRYENYTLPAGTYKALKIVIGEGKGKNWWCVMFPSVCIPAFGNS